MKRLLVIALLTLLAFACSQDNEEARKIMAGRWKYDTEAILKESEKLGLTEQEAMRVQGSMAVYKDAVFTFKPDSTLVVESNGITQFGSWKMSKNGNTLYLNLSGQDQPNQLSELSSERFVLAPDRERSIFYPRIFMPAD